MYTHTPREFYGQLRVSAYSSTLLCVINCLVAFIANGRRTFDTKFSTILRTTRDLPLMDRTDEEIEYVLIHDEEKSTTAVFEESGDIVVAE